jgi:broad specificity phosphatase PhoE
MTTLLLIRHGHTEALGHVLCGRMPGVHLSARGRAEAAELAAQMTGPLHAVYTSPRTRARETAAPIAERFGLPVAMRSDFDEIDFGDWTGLSFDALAPRPDWQLFNRARSLATIPGGESLPDLAARVRRGLSDLGDAYPGQRVAVVSHADVIKAALFQCDSRSWDAMPYVDIPPASVHAVEWLAPDRPRLLERLEA